MTRENKKIVVFDIDEEDFHDLTIDEVIEWLSRLKSEIPEEYQSQAKFNVETFDEGSNIIEILYYRPETDDEINKKIKERQESDRRLAQNERELWEILNNKYGK